MNEKKYVKVELTGVYNVEDEQIAICRENKKGNLMLVENGANGKFVASSLSPSLTGVAFCECDWNGENSSEAFSKSMHDLKIYNTGISSSRIDNALDLYTEDEVDREILLATSIAPGNYLFGELLEQKEEAEGFEELDNDSLKRLFDSLSEAAANAPTNEAEEEAFEDVMRNFFGRNQQKPM